MIAPGASGVEITPTLQIFFNRKNKYPTNIFTLQIWDRGFSPPARFVYPTNLVVEVNLLTHEVQHEALNLIEWLD